MSPSVSPDSRPTRSRPQDFLPPRRVFRASHLRLGGREARKPVSEPGLRRIKKLDCFRDRPSEVVAADAIPNWLVTPYVAFDGLKSLEVIKRGEINRLWNIIFYLESGVAN